MIHVVLVAPEIPGNTGNIGRTCLAAGAHLHLVKPLGFSLDDARVKRAGLDYWKHVPLTVHETLEEAAQSIPGFDQALWFSTHATTDFHDVEIPQPAVLIFGRETAGLGDKLRAENEVGLVRLSIHSEHIRSLNLANSAAIAIYETLRQRRGAKKPS
jgi:tRNA (cytidine/uridine-2'-O-)-methyltransferase